MNRYEGRRARRSPAADPASARATVLRLLEEGGTVVAADVSEAGLQDTVQRAPLPSASPPSW
ncbi:hypothetical protein [Streptomyces sp. KL116D]|uniref:hypothetical protein n=1 Tax=Streptomyces sp. KL116D TaxID=3045152 RepID=UPI003558F88B